MALDTVPFLIDGTTCDGEVVRRAVGSVLNPAGGIISPGDFTVAQQATPNMSVAVSAGQIWVPGTSSASQGMYYARNGAAVTLAIAASSPSYPRLDQVIAQAQDAAYAGTSKDVQLAVVTGTPTAGASLTNLVGLGALPASSLLLAYVLVPAGDIDRDGRHLEHRAAGARRTVLGAGHHRNRGLHRQPRRLRHRRSRRDDHAPIASQLGR